MPNVKDPRNLPPAGTSDFVKRLRSGSRASRLSEPTEEAFSPDAPSENESVAADIDAGLSSLEHLSATRESGPPHKTSGVRKVACMVTHGMGEQVRFETCAQIAEAFASARTPHSVQANRVQLIKGGELLARMEVVFSETETEDETHIHIYEGYWAPLTEGKISLTKTLLFCFAAGWRGLIALLPKTHHIGDAQGDKTEVRGAFFTRWVFQAMRAFPVKRKTFSMLFWLLVILLTGVALAYVCEQNLVHLLKSIQKSWQSAGSAHLPCDCSFQDKIAFYSHTILSHLHALLSAFRTLGSCWMKVVFNLVGLILGAIYAYWFRYFIVEFMGDVVIYVASYKVSEYEEIRSAIQKMVVDVGKQIVAATTPPSALDASPEPGTESLYDKLIFVGHSLGSVITYDLLNALIVWDATGCEGRHNVVDRIERLITFGSPLDKTAFLFRSQTRRDHHYREAMAGLMQPLIVGYDFRPFPWVNLYSHNDPVSGSLAYYDLPPGLPLPPGAQRIINQIDPAASTPVLAHLQYWEGDLLRRHLIAAMMGTPPPQF